MNETFQLPPQPNLDQALQTSIDIEAFVREIPETIRLAVEGGEAPEDVAHLRERLRLLGALCAEVAFDPSQPPDPAATPLRLADRRAPEVAQEPERKPTYQERAATLDSERRQAISERVEEVIREATKEGDKALYIANIMGFIFGGKWEDDEYAWAMEVLYNQASFKNLHDGSILLRKDPSQPLEGTTRQLQRAFREQVQQELTVLAEQLANNQELWGKHFVSSDVLRMAGKITGRIFAKKETYIMTEALVGTGLVTYDQKNRVFSFFGPSEESSTPEPTPDPGNPPAVGDDLAAETTAHEETRAEILEDLTTVEEPEGRPQSFGQALGRALSEGELARASMKRREYRHGR